LYNGMNRKIHPTMDNSDIPKLFGVMMVFLNLNKGCRFDSKFAHDNGLNSLLSLPLTNESLEISDNLKNSI